MYTAVQLRKRWSWGTEIRTTLFLKLHPMCFPLILLESLLISIFARRHSEPGCCLWSLTWVAWFTRDRTAWLWGEFSPSQLNTFSNPPEHFRLLCFPWPSPEIRYLPAISCADRLGTKPLSSRAKRRTGGIRVVIWEDWWPQSTCWRYHLVILKPWCRSMSQMGGLCRRQGTIHFSQV